MESVHPSSTTQLTSGQVIEDLEALVTTIESCHPDPFNRCGGRIAFYRRVHQLASGLPGQATAGEVADLFAPVIGMVRDAHTQLIPPQDAVEAVEREPGYWVLYQVLDGELVVDATYGPELADLIGARLQAVNGVPVSALADALDGLVGHDNQVDLLTQLERRTLVCLEAMRHDHH